MDHKILTRILPRLTALLAALSMIGVHTQAAAQPKEQFVPAMFYWVGPYAAGGSGISGGLLDYLDMLNRRDGGINGVKFTWQKCETEYNNARGVECYERLKNSGPTGATLVHPLSTAGEQVQWALERLELDAKRLKELGATGFMPPLETSCADHEGSGLVRFQKWDGRWKIATDWMAPMPEDRKLVKQKYVASAQQYAKEKGITPRQCAD
jgi:hypothetical protein